MTDSVAATPSHKPGVREKAQLLSTREIERSLGDGVKRVYASELSAKQKLRRVVTPASAQLTHPDAAPDRQPVAMV